LPSSRGRPAAMQSGKREKGWWRRVLKGKDDVGATVASSRTCSLGWRRGQALRNAGRARRTAHAGEQRGRGEESHSCLLKH
jgi:hypothetical protein